MWGVLLYPLAAAIGMVASAALFERFAPDEPQPDAHQRHMIFLGALVGAAVFAKLGFVFAEGAAIASDPRLDSAERWLQLLKGKTVAGALLGAYLGVEVAKRACGYTRPTGDRFAVVAPAGLAIARVGCLAQGCCLGRPMEASFFTLTDAHGIARWPAVPLELAFNLLLLAFALGRLVYRRTHADDPLSGQLFHVYLMAYGLFRFGHEFVRATPRLFGPVSGYHLLALALFALGAVRFRQRARQRPAAPSVDRAHAQPLHVAESAEASTGST